MTKQGKELLEHGLKDMYDAEHRFVQALETMIDQVTDEALTDGFRRHLRVTKEQIRRLESCFDELGQSPKREDCPGSKGLIAEYQKFVKEEKPDAATLNAFAAEAAQKVEHYEIVSYRSLLSLAEFLGLDACARAFRQNLAEEEETAAELRSASEVLAAELTGAPVTGVVRRAAGSVFDQMRDGAVATAGTARAVGQVATRRTGKMVERAERRGRRAVRSAQKRGQTAKAKASRRKAGSVRKTSVRKTTTRSTPARKAARASTARRPASRTGTRRTATRSTTGRARSNARRPASRKTAGRTSGRSTARKSTRARSGR
jgi:ferritin-like metal-binding protein YciE